MGWDGEEGAWHVSGVAHIRAGMLVTLCKTKLLTLLPEVNV